MPYAVEDPQVSGQQIVQHGVYLTRQEAQYQSALRSALRSPTVVVPVGWRAWFRWMVKNA